MVSVSSERRTTPDSCALWTTKVYMLVTRPYNHNIDVLWVNTWGGYMQEPIGWSLD